MAPLLKDTVTRNCSHSSAAKATSGLAGWVFYWCTLQIIFVSSFSQGSKCELVLNDQLNFFQQLTGLKKKTIISVVLHEIFMCEIIHWLDIFVFSSIVQLWPSGEPEFGRYGGLFHLIMLYDTIKCCVLSTCVEMFSRYP